MNYISIVLFYKYSLFIDFFFRIEVKLYSYEFFTVNFMETENAIHVYVQKYFTWDDMQ